MEFGAFLKYMEVYVFLELLTLLWTRIEQIRARVRGCTSISVYKKRWKPWQKNNFPVQNFISFEEYHLN